MMTDVSNSTDTARHSSIPLPASHQLAVANDPLEGFDVNSKLDFAIANALGTAEPALEPHLVHK